LGALWPPSPTLVGVDRESWAPAVREPVTAAVLESLVRELDEAFARRDLRGVLAFYEDNAVVVAEPGRIVKGRAALEKLFTDLFTLNGHAEQLKIRVIEADDIALFISRWRFSGTSPGGESFTRDFVATSVFRKGADQRWRLIVDNSFGPAVLDAADT
jgi:uncharacterized protein (TIGR02246 family)